ncbi:chemotaxis protein CheW [Pelosinus sp. IPA-1]|uniref:chemotaxis protein CheW n=1 Tax=Pelosinus sp. IPA-1 TaxID=3029569 RepID=UPI0024362875|nr:chemotaxis protein CheW [Pelosinus sp. IPA-1]GMB01159.1 chemotaxis protein CheW [Pelosinus sp. IPA-1]
MSIQLVVFALDNEEYGINISSINGILRAKKFKIRSLPGTGSGIEGMINLRGSVNYIFNLRAKFNLPEKEIMEESKFIMLNVNGSTTGCIVDEVTDIVKLDDTEIQLTPDFINSHNANYILGIGQIEDRMIIILDPEKIFSEEYDTIQGAIE